jgi:hypothetical protein
MESRSEYEPRRQHPHGAGGCDPKTSIDRKDGKNVCLRSKNEPIIERFAALVAAAEREAIMDEWSACVQSDLENGVRWLNEQAAKKWQESYPAMAGFADKIYARGETK